MYGEGGGEWGRFSEQKMFVKKKDVVCVIVWVWLLACVRVRFCFFPFHFESVVLCVGVFMCMWLFVCVRARMCMTTSLCIGVCPRIFPVCVLTCLCVCGYVSLSIYPRARVCVIPLVPVDAFSFCLSSSRARFQTTALRKEWEAHILRDLTERCQVQRVRVKILHSFKRITDVGL